MKLLLPSVFCVFAIGLAALAQVPAHQSVIDGRWEVKVTTPGGEEITRFEFKNADGAVSGTVTEGKASPLEIKNGTLDGIKLTFGTMQAPVGNGDSLMVTWAGTVIGEGASIKLIRTPDSGSGVGSRELEVKRMPQ